MRQSDIKVGKTYYNRGKGNTQRTVIAISSDIPAPWGSTHDKPDSPVVLYQQDGAAWRIYLRSFATWAGGEVLVTAEAAKARPLIDTSKYDEGCESNWALSRLAEIGRRLDRMEKAAAVTKGTIKTDHEGAISRLSNEWNEISEFLGQEFTRHEIATWHASYLK